MRTTFDDRHERGGKTAARTTQVDAASSLMLELLDAGPVLGRDVKAEAEARGLQIGETAWQAARKRLGVMCEPERQTGPWWWSLPSGDVVAEFNDWLETPAGKFAQYVADRSRLLETVEPGEQLTFDVEEGS